MDLPPEEIAYQQAHIDEDRTGALIALCTVFTSLAVLLFLIRILARRLLNAGIGLDDWLAFISTIFIIGLNITACLLASYGIGRHLLWVAMRHPEYFDKIRIVEIIFSFLYVFCLCFSKLSVLALYDRTFSQSNRLMRIGIWICAVYTILWGVGVQLAMGLATHITTEFKIPWGMSISVGVTNCIGDVAVLLLPQPLIWKLHQTLQKRIFLSGIFLMGLFAILVGIVRLPLLRGLPGMSPYDKTWTGFESIFLSTAEPAVVVMCCCAPPAAGLLRVRSPGSSSKYSHGSSGGYLKSEGTSENKSFGMISNRFRKDRKTHSESSEALELGPTSIVRISQTSTRRGNQDVELQNPGPRTEISRGPHWRT